MNLSQFVDMSQFVSICRYVEKVPGKFVADTSCEKLPKELCGKGELAKTCLPLFSCMTCGKCMWVDA